MPTVDLLQRVGDLADGRLGARRVDREGEQVLLEARLRACRPSPPPRPSVSAASAA